MRLLRQPGRGRPVLTAGVVLVVFASMLAVSTQASAQPAAAGGGSSADAAASCWEIKQNNPNAANGTYWLQTPALVAPERFYCDMTTDGGGWVLIGRGREGWRPEHQGQGTPAQVRDTITGPAAFAPRQLDSDIVDGLLNGGRVDELDDGIRVRRATNTSGTAWQEARFTMPNRDRWVWSHAAEHRVGSYNFGGSSGSGGQTNNFGNDSLLRPYNRIDTRERQDQGYLAGWAYGSRVDGTSGATSYLWSRTSGAAYARPFTQVFLRPKLTQADLNYGAIPNGGTAAQQRSPLLQSGVEPQQWGVTGRVGGETGEHYTETQDFTQVGNTVFVGGNFQYVQKGANPGTGERIAQSFLAGFNVQSGEWASSFRPVFNGQVKSLAALPGGRLVAGGEFTQVNGQPAEGLVALNPATGAIDTGWRVTVENRLTCCDVNVWTMDVQGDWLYLGGAFTHLRGGNQTQPAYARNAARVSVANGSADTNWNPEFNGTVYDLDASADGQRLYAAGPFTRSKQAVAEHVGIISTQPGAAQVPGMNEPEFSHPIDYQQAIVEAGDRVYVGGSEHSLFGYAKSDFSLQSGSITKAGGDFQSADAFDGVVYGTCHCENWNYSEAYTWSNVGTDWTQADKISFIGAYDAATGDYLPGFTPRLRASRSQGPWGAFQDSTGTAWFSGDFVSGQRTNGAFTWLGGFARFAPRDTSAPSTPGNLSGTNQGNGTARLSWSGSTDNRGVTGYEVLRGDRVVASTTGQTSAVVPAAAGARFFVRAIDGEGNRSASTPVYTLPAGG